MAFAGLKKQINKANQYVTEKMGGAEGTKLDLDFVEMERKTDVTVELVEELQAKTKEYLQPNPTARAKMAAVKGISKLSGQAKSNTYPQPEGILADCLLTYGKKLGEDSIFACAMIEMGESLRQMADVKYALDDNIKQNFLEPLHHLQTKDLKEVMHHRKKLQGRRLDYDCKRRRQAKGSHITDDEIRNAEEKFAESLHLAQIGMFNLLDNDVEQVSQLLTFAEGLLDYHQQSTEILKGLVENLAIRKDEAMSRPKSEFVPKTLADLNIEGISSTENGGNYHSNFSNLSSNSHHHQHMYSSQQNLSNHNNSSNAVTNNNFQRSRVFGSQQSLSTQSNRSSNSSIKSSQYNNNYNRNKPTTLATTTNNNNNYNNNNNSNYNNNNYNNNNKTASPLDGDRNSIDWLNAWNSPPPQTTAITATRSYNSNSNTSTNNFNSFNNQNNNSGGFKKPLPLTQKPKMSQFNDPWSASPLPSPMRSPARTPMPRPSGPCCSALYDFEAENPGELGFKENDVIQLISRVDENWYEGSVNGRTGYFPQSYVQIMVPLPN